MKPPILIVGSAYTGTTLLARVLGAHSQLHSFYETDVFYNTTDATSHVSRMVDLQEIAGDKRLVLHCPGHFWVLQRVWQYNPDAKVVVAFRDVRDILVGNMKREGTSQEYTIGTWARAAELTLWYQDRSEKFPNLRVHNHEKLCENFDGCVRSLLEWLEEDYEDLSEFYKLPYEFFGETIQPVEAPDEKHSKLTSPITTQWIGRWKKELTDEKLLYMVNHYEKLKFGMRRLGYEI